MLTREGGHRADRIVHAGGDATGAEVQRALHAAVRRDPWIRLVEHALVLDLLRDARPAGPAGRHPARARRGQRGRRRRGAGPGGRAGHRRDGPGLRRHHQPGGVHRRRRRAGAAGRRGGHRPGVRPVPPDRAVALGAGRRPASSRWSPRRCAARARYLVDGDGKRFMVGPARAGRAGAPRRGGQGHPPGACWPTGADHVYLDARHLGREFLADRFPTIVASCRAAGIDPATDLIPVAPGRALRLRRRPHRPARPHLASPACTPAARSPAPACTAPTGWPPTRCWRGWSSPGGSPTTSPRDLPAAGRPGAGAGRRRAGSADAGGPRRRCSGR